MHAGSLALLNLRPLYPFIVAFVVLAVLMAIRGSRWKKARSAAISAMGFADVERSEIFGPIKVEGEEFSCRVGNLQISSIQTPVAKGTSALGETIIFDIEAHTAGLEGAGNFFTVVGFRAAKEIPEFEIHHRYLLDRFLKKKFGPKAQVARPAQGQPQNIGRLQIRQPLSGAEVPNEVQMDGNREFSDNFIVLAHDPDSAKRMITASLMATLVSMNDSTLYLKKVQDWIFVYRQTGNAVRPEKYPSLIEEAVDLAKRLNLSAATDSA